MPERKTKSKRQDARYIQQIGNFDIPTQFEAQGPGIKDVGAVHESGRSRIILCDELKITYDCVAFEKCNDVCWYKGKFLNRTVAIKKKPKTKRLEVIKEVNLLEKIDRHDNVMRYWYHTEDIENCYIVTDYGMGLHEYINERRSIDPRNSFQQLCEAVAFLHGKNILLLNINPKNVRLMEVNGLMRIKLTNFESSFQLEHNTAILGTKVDRYLEFAAPEIKDVATFSSDIYSLGCLFYFVLTAGKLLRFGLNKSHNELLEKLENSKIEFEIISFVDIVRYMVKFCSNQRPNINEILDHPCFWCEHEFFELIMNVCKSLENRTERKKIRKNVDENRGYQRKVIGRNWKSRIDLDSSSLQYSGSGTSICDLVKFIRNNYAHRNDVTLGKTKAELMAYWVEKFPYLIIYLYKVKYLFDIK